MKSMNDFSQLRDNFKFVQFSSSRKFEVCLFIVYSEIDCQYCSNSPT